MLLLIQKEAGGVAGFSETSQTGQRPKSASDTVKSEGMDITSASAAPSGVHTAATPTSPAIFASSGSKRPQPDQAEELKQDGTSPSDPGFALPDPSEQSHKRGRNMSPLAPVALVLPLAIAQSVASPPVVVPTSSLMPAHLPGVESMLKSLSTDQPAAGQSILQTVTVQLPQAFSRGGRFWLQAQLDDCVSAPFALPTYSTKLDPGAATQQGYWRRYMYPAAMLRRVQ